MPYGGGSMIPETKGRSLEEMDIIFGSITADQRQADIERQEKRAFSSCSDTQQLTFTLAEYDREQQGVMSMHSSEKA